jgi:hypothetical protein
MITVAVSGLTASDLGPRPKRAAAGKLMTVPISFPRPETLCVSSAPAMI